MREQEGRSVMKAASDGAVGEGKGRRPLRHPRRVQRGSQSVTRLDGTRRGDLPWRLPITHLSRLGGCVPCAAKHRGDTISVSHSLVFMRVANERVLAVKKY